VCLGTGFCIGFFIVHPFHSAVVFAKSNLRVAEETSFKRHALLELSRFWLHGPTDQHLPSRRQKTKKPLIRQSYSSARTSRFKHYPTSGL
jgi:hypothetical protein